MFKRFVDTNSLHTHTHKCISAIIYTYFAIKYSFIRSTFAVVKPQTNGFGLVKVYKTTVKQILFLLGFTFHIKSCAATVERLSYIKKYFISFLNHLITPKAFTYNIVFEYACPTFNLFLFPSYNIVLQYFFLGIGHAFI